MFKKAQSSARYRFKTAFIKKGLLICEQGRSIYLAKGYGFY
jgi:hypothetical protein